MLDKDVRPAIIAPTIPSVACPIEVHLDGRGVRVGDGRLIGGAGEIHDGPTTFDRCESSSVAMPEVPASGVLSMTEGSSAETGNGSIDDVVEGLTAAAARELALEPRK